MSGVYFVRPGLHPFAYVPGWLLLAGLIYQSDLSNGVRFRRVPTGGTSIASSIRLSPRSTGDHRQEFSQVSPLFFSFKVDGKQT